MAEEIQVNIKSEGLDETISKLESTSELAKKSAEDFGLMDTQAGRAFKAVVSGAQKGIAAMKTLKGAVAATGIGALAIVVASLVAYFTKTERGAQSLKKVMAALGAVVSTVVESFIKIGETLVKIGKIVGQVVKGNKTLAEGWKETKETVKDAAGDIVDSYQQIGDKVRESIALQERENQLRLKNRAFLVEEAKLQVSLSEARLKTNDQTLTANQRLEALNEAQSLNNTLFAKRIEQAREEYEIQKERNAQFESTAEDLQKEAELQANLIKLEADRNAANKEFSDQKSALLKAEQDKLKAAEEAAIKAKEEEDKKKEEEAKKEIERQAKVNEELEKLNDEFYMSKIEKEEERRQIALEKEKEEFEEDLQRRLENAEITEEELLKLKEAYGLNWLEKKKALDKEILDAAAEAAKAEAEIEAAKKAAKVEGALGAAEAVLGAIKAVFGETKAGAIAETIINTYKAATSAYAAMSGIPVVGPARGSVAAAAAVVSGLKQLSVIKSTNYKGGSAGGGETFSANQNPTMQEGGWIGGPRHSQGGVTINAEGGEYMASQRTMSSGYGPMIVAANEAVNRGQSMNTGITFEQAVALINAQEVAIVESKISNKQKEVSIRESSFKK